MGGVDGRSTSVGRNDQCESRTCGLEGLGCLGMLSATPTNMQRAWRGPYASASDKAHAAVPLSGKGYGWSPKCYDSPGEVFSINALLTRSESNCRHCANRYPSHATHGTAIELPIAL